MTADAWGIDSGYEDALGNWRDTSEASRKAVLEAMGVDPSHPAPPPKPQVRVIRPGETLSFEKGGDLRLEDGTELSFEKQLPPDLPFGYHSLLPRGAKSPLRLIASPGKCFLPESLKIWGWAVQLYSLRSSRSWGMGDFADLRSIGPVVAEGLGGGHPLDQPDRRRRTRNAPEPKPVLSQQPPVPKPPVPSHRRYSWSGRGRAGHGGDAAAGKGSESKRTHRPGFHLGLENAGPRASLQPLSRGPGF